ncbi:MAG: hypothetical protein ACOYOB_03450 [Myxococcota bacterium]
MPLPSPQPQVVVVADDPIEAGMLALDLVQAGIPAQAVRDTAAVYQQVQASPRDYVVVAAHRDLAQTAEVYRSLTARGTDPAFVAVVLRVQREAAEGLAREAGWAGVAVRPVNADELVGIVQHAAARGRPEPDRTSRAGSLVTEPLPIVLAAFLDRHPKAGSGRTVLVRLESEGRRGLVAVVDGELVHAEVDGERGRHVLERLCSWREGSYECEPARYEGSASLMGSSLGLLAVAQEYARRVAEARQSLPDIDCVWTVRWERVRPLPVVAESLFRRIASGVVLGDALSGDGDDELEAFAALEARIKRGAVVPKIDSAPRPPPGEAPARVTTPIPRAHRNSSGFSIPAPVETPISLGDHRRHPITNIYRTGDERLAPGFEVRPSEPSFSAPPSDLPPELPKRPLSGAIRQPTPVSGWFGLQVGDEGESVELRHEGGLRSAVRTDGRDRLVAPSHRVPSGITSPSLGEPIREASSPYAWVPPSPGPAIDDEDDEPLPRVSPRRWPWLVAAALLSAGIAVLLWPVAPPPVVAEDPKLRAYLRANALIDAGQTTEAVALLRELMRQPDVEPEAGLQLGVLEAQAGQFEAARAHLLAYLAIPDARHAGRARAVYQHLFGSSATAQASGPPGAAAP